MGMTVNQRRCEPRATKHRLRGAIAWRMELESSKWSCYKNSKVRLSTAVVQSAVNR